MKVLLRNYMGEQYVWKKAEMKNDVQFTLEDGGTVNQANIVSISRDNRKKFVKCPACGRIVRNTPEAINEHKLRASTSATCFGCPYMKEIESKQLSTKYTLQEDGRYAANIKKSVRLVCRSSYRYYDINSQEARDCCRFTRCATAEMQNIEDIFTKYPGVFDDIITVDKVLDNGFTDRREYTRDNVVYYKLKARNNITAVVNKLNIIDYFVIDYRSNRYSVVYSKKYNKFFYSSSDVYRECLRPCSIPTSTFENIKAKIASLYN